MTDTFQPAKRSQIMRAIRGKDTTPEVFVRQLVHSLGFRFRLHRRDLPGTPDLVFPSLRRVIFVHGCFWHRHSCRKGRSTPATRRAFWLRKLDGNKIRDVTTRGRLRRMGWKILIVWECQTNAPVRLCERIARFLEAR